MISVPIEYLHECFDCDAEAGVLTWKTRPLSHFSHLRQCNATNSRLAGKRAGSLTSRGYLEVGLGGKDVEIKIRVHRIIWTMHTGAWPAEFIDHINRNKSDSRIANLREANRSQNGANQEAARHNKVGLKGVCAHGKRFRAQIHMGGKVLLLGIFDTPELAHQAYSNAAVKHHGEYAGGIFEHAR